MTKRKFFSLVGTLLVSTLMFSAVKGTNSRNVVKTYAEPVVDKYLPFNATNFPTMTNAPGDKPTADSWITERYGTFWTHRYFNALDNFYDGFHREDWTGTITSRTWTHKGGYVTFTLGGNAFEGAELRNYVSIMAGSNEVARVHNDAFSDPHRSLNMVLKVVNVPDVYIDQDLHLVIVDGKTGDFGAVTFGALKVNQTATEVARSLQTHKVSLAKIDTDVADSHKNSLARTATLDYYTSTALYAPFASTVLTSVDENFEVNDLTNWGYDIEFSQISGGNSDPYLGVNFTAGISSATTFWDEEVPFNKEGVKFYNGWDGAPAEEARYRFLSAPMKVSGSGIMSVKMGGHSAELQILDPDTLAIKATFLNPAFNDVPGLDKIVSSGTRLATMTRIVIDVSAYLNETVIIALADARVGGGWGVVFFDELVTYYETTPHFKLDLLSHAGENGVIKDMFLGPDGSDIKAAYTFLQNYYATVRSADSGFSHCTLLASPATAVHTMISNYDALTPSVKALVNASQDFDLGLPGSYANEVTLSTVGNSMVYIKANVGASGSGLLTNEVVSPNYMIYMLLFVLATGLAYIIYKKKVYKTR